MSPCDPALEAATQRLRACGTARTMDANRRTKDASQGADVLLMVVKDWRILLVTNHEIADTHYSGHFKILKVYKIAHKSSAKSTDGSIAGICAPFRCVGQPKARACYSGSKTVRITRMCDEGSTCIHTKFDGRPWLTTTPSTWANQSQRFGNVGTAANDHVVWDGYIDSCGQRINFRASSRTSFLVRHAAYPLMIFQDNFMDVYGASLSLFSEGRKA